MPAKTVDQKCKSYHFTCLDGTCILVDYVCDNVTYCVDNADEVGCGEILQYDQNQDKIYIPCSASHIEELLVRGVENHKRSENTLVGINSFCNGIITCNAPLEILLCEKMYNHRQNATLLKNGNEDVL